MTQPSTLATAGQADAPMLTDLKALTGASATISAAHRSRDGSLHGHTWQVTAWWPEGPDAVERQEALRSYLSIFDHTELGPDAAWAEALGKTILLGLNCCRVDVSRPLEGLHASVTRLTEKGPNHER